jgi:phage shock protein B
MAVVGGQLIALVGIVAPFAFVLAIIWMGMHYGHKRKVSRDQERRQAAQAPNEDYQALQALARRMEQRIEALEKLLDAEDPDWRKSDVA